MMVELQSKDTQDLDERPPQAPSGNAASGATHAIRAHLTHETPQHMTEEQRETLAERVGGDDTTLLQTRQDRQVCPS
jgi:hypothetical protein